MTSHLFCSRFFKLIVLIYFLFLSLPFALYIYDPFCFFHAPIFREKTFLSDSKNMRYALSGIIQYNQFNHVIAGSSMLEKTLSSEAEQILGGKWINLSSPSFSFYERDILFSYLFKNKNIKSVIYSLESYYLLNDSLQLYKNEKNNLTQDLINGGGGGIAYLKYYLNQHFIQCVLKWSNEEQCVGKKNIGFDGLEKIPSGFQNWSMIEKNLFQKELEKYKKNLVKTVPFDIEKQKKFLYEKILKHVQNNPKTIFYFILPTQSRFFYKIPYAWSAGRSAQQYFQDYQKIMFWFLKECAQYKNVQVYGLDLLDYADNLNNYWDARHYNPDLNSLQLKSIAENKNRIHAQNMEHYFFQMQEKIQQFDLTPFIPLTPKIHGQ